MMNVIARNAALVAGALLLLVAVMTTVDVALRYFFNRPWEGSLEVVENAYVFIVFLGLASEIMDRREIRVDVLTTHAKGWMYLVFECISLVTSIAFFCIVIWYGSLNWLRAWHIGDVGMGALRVPTVIPWGGIVLGSALAIGALITRVIALIRDPFTPPAEPPLPLSIE